MINGHRVLGSAVLSVLLVVCLMATAHAQPATTNEVVQWNETTLKVIAAGGQAGIVTTRTLAMVQAAVHDALNAISRRYDAYFFEGTGETGASPDVAVAAAAHRVLVGVVPSVSTPAQRVAAHGIDTARHGVVEDALGEAHQGIHRLVLGRGSDISVHRPIRQERFDLGFGGEEVFAGPHAVETDEPDDPLHRGSLGVNGIVVETEHLADVIKECWWLTSRRIRHRRFPS